MQGLLYSSLYKTGKAVNYVRLNITAFHYHYFFKHGIILVEASFYQGSVAKHELDLRPTYINLFHASVSLQYS